MKRLRRGTTLVVLALAVSAPLLASEEAKVDCLHRLLHVPHGAEGPRLCLQPLERMTDSSVRHTRHTVWNIHTPGWLDHPV